MLSERQSLEKEIHRQSLEKSLMQEQEMEEEESLESNEQPIVMTFQEEKETVVPREHSQELQEKEVKTLLILESFIQTLQQVQQGL